MSLLKHLCCFVNRVKMDLFCLISCSETFSVYLDPVFFLPAMHFASHHKRIALWIVKSHETDQSRFVDSLWQLYRGLCVCFLLIDQIWILNHFPPLPSPPDYLLSIVRPQFIHLFISHSIHSSNQYSHRNSISRYLFSTGPSHDSIPLTPRDHIINEGVHWYEPMMISTETWSIRWYD